MLIDGALASRHGSCTQWYAPIADSSLGLLHINEVKYKLYNICIQRAGDREQMGLMNRLRSAEKEWGQPQGACWMRFMRSTDMTNEIRGCMG